MDMNLSKNIYAFELMLKSYYGEWNLAADVKLEIKEADVAFAVSLILD